HWDGKDANGNQLENGLYGFSVVATDAEDKVVQTAQGIQGSVTGIQLNSGVVVLNMGEVEIPLSSVQAVIEKPTTSTGST
ncbi:hypothetical protein A9Q97_00255, partial [Rhodospirillales bacterium 47_12_T64]